MVWAAICRGQQKGAGIAASPRVTGLRPQAPKDVLPGFGGMLRSRRQGHASFASVTGIELRFRRSLASITAARFATAGGIDEALLDA